MAEVYQPTPATEADKIKRDEELRALGYEPERFQVAENSSNAEVGPQQLSGELTLLVQSFAEQRTKRAQENAEINMEWNSRSAVERQEFKENPGYLDNPKAQGIRSNILGAQRMLEKHQNNKIYETSEIAGFQQYIDSLIALKAKVDSSGFSAEETKDIYQTIDDQLKEATTEMSASESKLEAARQEEAHAFKFIEDNQARLHEMMVNS